MFVLLARIPPSKKILVFIMLNNNMIMGAVTQNPFTQRPRVNETTKGLTTHLDEYEASGSEEEQNGDQRQSVDQVVHPQQRIVADTATFTVHSLQRRLHHTGEFVTTVTTLRRLQSLLKERSQVKLDGHGRARREAARRRKSECKVNLFSRNSSRSNGSW